MKMKEFEPPGGRASLASPLDLPMVCVSVCLCFHVCTRVYVMPFYSIDSTSCLSVCLWVVVGEVTCHQSVICVVW